MSPEFLRVFAATSLSLLNVIFQGPFALKAVLNLCQFGRSRTVAVPPSYFLVVALQIAVAIFNLSQSARG